ncbi:MAG: hypothetical protein ACI9FN_003395 [Saprospiraceae bacterium]|jgi:hypothetical protein
MSTIPLGKYLYKYPPAFKNLNFRRGSQYLAVLGVAMFCTLIVISIAQMIMNNAGINELGEVLLFFTFQKAPLFLSA